MEAFEAYVMYLALKRHFTLNSNYDYFKYKGKTNASKQSFETRKDKYSYHKLSRKENPFNFVVANFAEHGSKVWVGDMVSEKQYEDTYLEWNKRNQSLKYTYSQELSNIEDLDKDLLVVNGQYPKILQLHYRKKISLETLVILNELVEFLPVWDQNIVDPVMYPATRNSIIKYKPFLKFNRPDFAEITIKTLENN